MKHLVETNGDFMFLDPQSPTEIHANRPTVVTSNNFIEGRIAAGQLRLLASDIFEKATDEDFVAYWKENPKIAVEAFLSEFSSRKESESLLNDELVQALEEAISVLEEGDFQKDGKPKVGALAKLVEDFKIDTAVRDEFWDNR